MRWERLVLLQCVTSHALCPQLLASVGIILNGANVVGYVKCRRDAGSRLSSMATQFIGKKVLEQVKRVSK